MGDGVADGPADPAATTSAAGSGVAPASGAGEAASTGAPDPADPAAMRRLVDVAASRHLSREPSGAAVTVDLLGLYPVRRVVVAGGAGGLALEVAAGDGPPVPVAAVAVQVGGEVHLVPAEAVPARRVRVVGPGIEAGIEALRVLVHRDMVDMIGLWREAGLDPAEPVLGVEPPRPAGRRRDFTVIAGKGAALAPITGFAVGRAGRTGNTLVALARGIAIARRLGLPRVRIKSGGIFDLDPPRRIANLEFEDDTPPLGPAKYLTSASMAKHAGGLEASFSDEAMVHIVETYLRPLAFPWRTYEGLARPDEAVLHCRGGDIFRVPPIHAGYIQPPLSYYQSIVEALLAEDRIARVRVVYEDRSNPCVDGLEAWLAARGIPFAMQSKSLREDLAVLASARHLVSGYGSFALSAAVLSGGIERFYAFRMQPGWAARLVGQWIQYDADRTYIQPSQWTSSPEQHDLMLTYPAERLVTVTRERDGFGAAVLGWKFLPDG